MAFKRLLKFSLLWWGFFVAILLMAIGEGFVLWLGGVEYRPKSSFVRVWASDLAIDRDGDRGVARVSFKRNSVVGSWVDVVLIDFRRQDATTLDLEKLAPDCVALSPGADGLAISCMDGSIYSWTSPFDAPLREAASRRLDVGSRRQVFSRLVFSPNGQFLSAISDDTVFVWQWPSGKLLHRRPHLGEKSRALLFSPDSQSIISPGKSGGICRWEVESGNDSETLVAGETDVFDVGVSFDAQLVAITTAGNNPGLVIYRFGDTEALWHETTLTLPHVAFDCGGQRVASVIQSEGTGSIKIQNAEDGRTLCTLNGGGAVVVGMTFSSDGLLYEWDVAGNVRAWDVDEQRVERSLSLLDWASGEF